jgi:hypothetical protein
MWTKFIAVLFLLTQPCLAASYYVDSTDGSDAASGLSTALAWQNVSKVNGFTFADGDSILFQRGETFSDATLTLATGPADNLTIGAYGTGDAPRFGNGAFRPIRIIERVNNFTIQDLALVNQEFESGVNQFFQYFLYLDDMTGLDVNNIYIDGHEGWVGSTPKHGISIQSSVGGAITIRNCEIKNLGPATIASGSYGIDQQAINIQIHKRADAEIRIHDNLIHDIESDGMLLWRSTTQTYVYGNTIYNCGEQTMDIKSTANVEVYDNVFYRESNFTGTGGTGSNPLVLLVCGQFDADLNAVDPCKNVQIHDNQFLGGNAWGIGTELKVSDLNIWNNLFQDCDSGAVLVPHTASTVQVWNNLGINSGTMSFKFGEDCLVMHNSIYGGEIDIYANTSCVIANNIIVATEAAEYPLFWNGTGTEPAAHHNTLYSTASTKRADWNSTTYVSSDLATWISAGHTGDLFSAPLYTSSTNLVLQSNSPAIDVGADAGISKDYLDALRPQGSGFDMGAYEQADGVRKKTLFELMIF